MNKKLNLELGQKVYIRIIPGSNAATRMKMTLNNLDEWCFEGEITKLGKKYVTAKFGGFTEEQFSVEDDYRQKYLRGGANYKLYKSKNKIIEEVEYDELHYSARTAFNDNKCNKFTLDQLRRINGIIAEPTLHE